MLARRESMPPLDCTRRIATPEATQREWERSLPLVQTELLDLLVQRVAIDAQPGCRLDLHPVG